MIQCSECEYFVRGPEGKAAFLCDPFSTIKEPECLLKWQFIKLDGMVRAYQATLDHYKRLAPLQEKMFRHMEREIDEIEDQEQWKFGQDEDESDEDDDRTEDEDRRP